MNNKEINFNIGFEKIRATVISLVPFPINEFKPGLYPGQFDIPPSVDGEPQCLVIPECLFYVYIDKDRGHYRVPAPSYKVAESIVQDYNSAQLRAGVDCHPALFYKIGEFTKDQAKQQFADDLKRIRQIQMNWFMELVLLADDDWEKTRQHAVISDTQRFAARALDPNNTKQRPWLLSIPKEIVSAESIETTICPACGSDIPKSVILCRYCHCILDPEKYKKLSFAAALPSTSGGDLDLSKIVRQ